jgi:hypothetical protein
MKRIIRVFSLIAVVVVLLLAGGAVPPVAATSGVIIISIDAPYGVDPDSDFTANVSISQVTDFDACQYDVSFDASVLRLDDVTSGLIGATEVPVDIYHKITTGTYRLVQNVPGLVGASGSGYLAELHFHVIGGKDSQISLSNGMLSDITASGMEATWAGGSVIIMAEIPEATILPPAASLSPEPTTSPPESAPEEAVSVSLLPPPPPDESDSWPVLWLVIGGVVLVGLIIISVIARRRAY